MAQLQKKIFRKTSEESANLPVGKKNPVFVLAIASFLLVLLVMVAPEVRAQTASRAGCEVLDNRASSIF